MSLDALATAGMSRPLALLKTAALTQRRARQRHETLAAVITLVDRLVTDAARAPTARLVDLGRVDARVAAACGGRLRSHVRQALAERLERRARGHGALPDRSMSAVSAPQPLADMAHTLEQLAVVLRVGARSADHQGDGAAALLARCHHEPRVRAVRHQGLGRRADLLPPLRRLRLSRDLHLGDHVLRRLAVDHRIEQPEGTPALRRRRGRRRDGPGRARVRCSPTWRASAASGWSSATGTAVAAWINFGSPRISYGGYQTGLAFYKATLQGFGHRGERDRRSRSTDRRRLRADRVRPRRAPLVAGSGGGSHARAPRRRRSARLPRSPAWRHERAEGDVDARRQLISQQVADVQGFIESSKFEPGTDGADAETVERLTADAQTVFLVLVGIARGASQPPRPPDRGAGGDDSCRPGRRGHSRGSRGSRPTERRDVNGRSQWLRGGLRPIDRGAGRRDGRGRDLRGSACAIP